MKRNHGASVVMLILILGIALTTGCAKPESGSNIESEVELKTRDVANISTDTRSTIFQNDDEKLTFLEKYVNLPSAVIDSEYHIIYHDNSTGMVPGPSDWDIRMAVKVAEADIPLWTEGMKKVVSEQVDLTWWEDLKEDMSDWEILSWGECYKHPTTQSYMVVYPDNGVILKFASTMYIPSQETTARSEEAISGYDEFKSIVAKRLDYDETTIPYIDTVQAESALLAEGVSAKVICYNAKYYDSTIYGIPVMVISSDNYVICEVLEEGSYSDQFSLADIDGDGCLEILMQHNVDSFGGAGAYVSAIYKVVGESLETLFVNPDWKNEKNFHSGFQLLLSDGCTFTVENKYTGFQKTFTRSDSKESPYFDEQGNLTDKGRENNEDKWLGVDPFFYEFEPMDVDDDGVSEISVAQYTYFWGRTDYVGSAISILKWNQDTRELEVVETDFYS